MARQAASQSESGLYYKELYDPLALDGSFASMDGLYEVFSRKPVKWTISEAARAAAKDQYALEAAAELSKLEKRHSDAPPEGDTADDFLFGRYPGSEYVKDIFEKDADECEKKAESAQLERKKWARTVEIPCKEAFCMHYRRLRLLLFRNDFQEALVRTVEHTLDIVLLEEKASRFMKGDLFAQVCAQLESASADVKEQDTVNG